MGHQDDREGGRVSVEEARGGGEGVRERGGECL